MRLDCGGQIVKGLEGHHKDLGFYSGRGAFLRSNVMSWGFSGDASG